MTSLLFITKHSLRKAARIRKAAQAVQRIERLVSFEDSIEDRSSDISADYEAPSSLIRETQVMLFAQANVLVLVLVLELNTSLRTRREMTRLTQRQRSMDSLDRQKYVALVILIAASI